jgi:membrane-associated phospholipid phosphatase
VKQFFVSLPGNIVGCFKGRLGLWHLVAVVLSAMCVMSGFDWLYYNFTRNPTLQRCMFPAVPIGGLLPIVLPVAVLVGGLLFRDARARLVGWAIGQSALIGSIVSSSYKALTGRVHPFHNGTVDISHEFRFGFLRGGIFWGWPSSHTTIAFAFAGAMFQLFPKQRWIGVMSFMYAFYVGFGVSMTIHWFSDFAAGAIIGTVIGMVVGGSFAEEMTNDLPSLGSFSEAGEGQMTKE